MQNAGKPAKMDTPGGDHIGLPWPEGYQDLRPVLQEQWGFSDDMYLHHKLSGKSGAYVYAADVHCSDFSGQAILKFDRAPDPAWNELSEAERHDIAFRVAPEFARAHLPELLKTSAVDDRIAILSSIAGRGLEYAKPWAECAHDEQVEAVNLLSSGLLEDWNRDCHLAAGLVSVGDILRGWLNYRLDPVQGRIFQFVQSECGLCAEDQSLIFDGRWYPNPLNLVAGASGGAADQKLRAVIGNTHGDLHGYNVLLGGSGSARLNYYLIDLALYQDKQFLFYDHAYFELSHLLLARERADAESWSALMGHLSVFDHAGPEVKLKGDDLGLIQLIETLRRNVMEWVDRNQSSRLSYMEKQYMLARVAVGLNFVNKPLSDKSRKMAFLYAAANLKDYVVLSGLDWPKHGPLFEITEMAGGGADGGMPVKSSSDGRFRVSDPTRVLPEDRPAVAVLAFDNLSGDPEQEYFSDGFSQELLTCLSSVDWLMVISRGSSFAYKGQPVDVKRIGRELGVDYIVEGSVRRAEARARISVQLIDARTSHHLWAERFDRDVQDIFDLQEEIAQAIAMNVDSRLKVVERERASIFEGSLSLWHGFQRAMWHFHKFSEEHTQTAQTLLGSLVETAPQFGEAHALLSFFDCRRITFCEAEKPEEVLDRARRQASLAVSLDDRSSMAKVALSRVLTFEGKHQRAVDQAELAVSLNPSSTVAHLCLAVAYFWGGQAEAAMPILETSIRLSPKGPFLDVKRCLKALCRYATGEISEAEVLARSACHSQMAGPVGPIVMSVVLARQDRISEANEVIQELLSWRPDFSISRFHRCWSGFAPDYLAMMTEDLHRAGLPE